LKQFGMFAVCKQYSLMEEGSARLSPECIHETADKVREARRFDEMAKRKKRIATVNRKLGITISCRVQKPFLKDLDAYRKPLKLSRPAALVRLATEHLAGLKEPAEKLWEGAVERMFPAASGVKGDDPR
jgi:hypothetical protein